MVDAEAKKFYNRIIFKKYKIKKLLFKSVFSYVYEGVNIKNNIPVTLKIEKKGKYDLLETEAYLLVNLKGFGIPEILSFGKYYNYKVLSRRIIRTKCRRFMEKKCFQKGAAWKKKYVYKRCLHASNSRFR